MSGAKIYYLVLTALCFIQFVVNISFYSTYSADLCKSTILIVDTTTGKYELNDDGSRKSKEKIESFTIAIFTLFIGSSYQ